MKTQALLEQFTTPELHENHIEMIVFGEDWGGHPSSTQHLIKRLLPAHKIVWINSLGLRRPTLSLRDGKRVINKLHAMCSPLDAQVIREVQEQGASDVAPCQIIAPKSISWPGNPLASQFNRLSLKKQIDETIARHNFKRPILWTSLPSAVDALECYPDYPVVYYCGDDFNALAGVDHEPVARMEQRLALRADLIITASRDLFERFPSHKTILLEHGVDYQHFSTPVSRAPDLPDHPRIAGFYGSLHDWLDQDMIATTARDLPDWKFVFIGDKHCDTGKLDSLDNIEFLGPRAHSRLPSYVQHWQASLLPFLDTPQIRACNPLKLREYLSAGKPVISTDFPAARSCGDRVRLVRSAADLTTALKAMAAEGPKEAMPDTRMMVQSWENKARLLTDHLLSF
ncbi:glycosyltransferase [Kiloniella sp. b19]|uniref:glycosyltransferase n=1 Tax=Kiloniella sp. GXU_MW_B19 TaxID=3141326 RepID=UPI0031DE7912